VNPLPGNCDSARENCLNSCYIAGKPYCHNSVEPIMSLPLPEEPVPGEAIRLEPGPMRQSSRWGLVVLAVALSGVLGIAGWLEPDDRGFGTHEQLGLPPCAFRALVRIPCPSCGMTTSFAYAVRGRLLSAASTNPGGCLLAIGAAGMIPWCLASAAMGRTIGIRSPERAAIVTVLTVLGISLLGWAVRLVIGS
jgi:hypothetical protein